MADLPDRREETTQVNLAVDPPKRKQAACGKLNANEKSCTTAEGLAYLKKL